MKSCEFFINFAKFYQILANIANFREIFVKFLVKDFLLLNQWKNVHKVIKHKKLP